MKAGLLLCVFLFTPVAMLQAQDLSNVECTRLKSAADTAYSIFEKEKQIGLLGDLKSYDQNRQSISFNTYFTNSLALINGDCLGKAEKRNLIAELNSNAIELAIAGSYFQNHNEYEKSTEYFLSYVGFCKSKMATRENRKSPNVLTFTYYAFVSSANTPNHQRTILLLQKIIPSVPKTSTFYNLRDLYYYLADEYRKMSNEDMFVAVINRAMKRLPREKQFFASVVVDHYMTQNNNAKALEYIDSLLKKTAERSDGYAKFLNVKANFLLHQKEYIAAQELYKEGLKSKPGNEELVGGLGLAYALHAQDMLVANRNELNPDITGCYKNAAELLEKHVALLKVRNAEVTDINRVVSYLCNIYYTLNMWQEFETIYNQYEKY